MRSFIAFSGFALAGLALCSLSSVQAGPVPGEIGALITASIPGETGGLDAARFASGGFSTLISQAAPGETGPNDWTAPAPRPIPGTNA